MSFPGKDNAEAKKLPLPDKSISRQHFTTTHKEVHKIEPVNNVIAVPQLPPVGNDSAVHNKQLDAPASGSKANMTKDGDLKGDSLNLRAIGSLIKNKTYELGVKLKNKTVEVGEKMKNKTLEQLAVIGVVAPKRFPQLVFAPLKWNLKVSFEDIGDIMKETQFLNKVDPLNLNGPILLSSRNRTANFTYTMPLKFGFCDCFERYCICCSQITNKRLHLNSTACSNFTFMSKTHVSHHDILFEFLKSESSDSLSQLVRHASSLFSFFFQVKTENPCHLFRIQIGCVSLF